MKLNKLIQALALAGLSSQALAQDVATQNDSTDADAKVERIRVTGSSIKRTALEGALPITVFSRADIDAAGITSAEQLLQFPNIASNGSDSLASNADRQVFGHGGAPGEAGLERKVQAHVQAADQVVLLKHQADPLPPPLRQRRFRPAIERNIVDQNTAAVRSVQASHQVQQSALAAARFAHQRQAAAPRQAHVHPLQYGERALGGGE